MTRTTREIVRYLEDGDQERDFPCSVGWQGSPEEACERPAAMEVYGLVFCEEHGEEAKDGALEEMHQDADEFFTRFTTPHVPDLPNPLLRAAVSRWRLTVPEGLEYSDKHTDELLLRAFPFREDKILDDTAGQIADPIPGNAPPYDSWRHHRYEMHAMMRAAYERGMGWLVENLEPEREVCAAQCAYALALDRGEYPEVLERAHQKNVESARQVAEMLAE